ncbi:MAG TPA: hypothetical protein DCS20_04570 [Candidatus Yonathbacteria bacterium]|nr:hypothetical protein [Candidatus Yonathbacteria bacterium]
MVPPQGRVQGARVTISVLVTEVAEPPGPVQVTVWLYVPGVFIGPVLAFTIEVPPRFPFQIPTPEQAVAFVELTEIVDD